MKKYAIIVGGGKGERLGSPIPKQFLPLKGYPVIWWSMKSFLDNDKSTNLILVLPEEYVEEWKKLFHALPEENQFPHQIISGGVSRTESVRKGLSLIKDVDSFTAVHDAARPLVNAGMIERGWQTAYKDGAAVPAVALSDSLRMKTEDNTVAVDRSLFLAVQTPQIFKTSYLIEGYNKISEKTFTDDASVVEASGRKVTIYEGDPANIKVTHPGDIEIATLLMRDR